MNKEIKDKWLKALRSGEYKQGHKRLCRTFNGEDLYCCLGVLANECAEGYWVPTGDWIFGDDSIVWGFTRPGDAGLPEEAMILSLEKELGIDEKAMFKLTNMNDVARSTFDEIADWIEKNL